VFQLIFFLLFSLHCLFFSYDLPPFLATLVLVFLLAEASPFLLDFFLIAIISRSFMYTLLLMIYLVRLDLWSFQFSRVILSISYAMGKYQSYNTVVVLSHISSLEGLSGFSKIILKKLFCLLSNS
jgi:hypothetical protein